MPKVQPKNQTPIPPLSPPPALNNGTMERIRQELFYSEQTSEKLRSSTDSLDDRIHDLTKDVEELTGDIDKLNDSVQLLTATIARLTKVMEDWE
jgi:chromosome segregation ATPase